MAKKIFNYITKVKTTEKCIEEKRWKKVEINSKRSGIKEFTIETEKFKEFEEQASKTAIRTGKRKIEKPSL